VIVVLTKTDSTTNKADRKYCWKWRQAT